jgi:hypothetical protein
MKDILLKSDGDLYIGATGDISLTDSIRQAVRVRLQWFFNEWRFAPQYGVPYFEDILIKTPNLMLIRRIIRNEALSVDRVIDAQNITITVDKLTRQALITLDIVTAEETFREEVPINV